MIFSRNICFIVVITVVIVAVVIIVVIVVIVVVIGNRRQFLKKPFRSQEASVSFIHSSTS